MLEQKRARMRLLPCRNRCFEAWVLLRRSSLAFRWRGLQCLSTCMNIIGKLKDTTGGHQLYNVCMSIIYVHLEFEQNFFDDG